MTSKYIGVHLDDTPRQGRPYSKWQAKLTVNGTKWRKTCKTEREAAIAVDRRLIELGKPPVNILKPIQ